MLYRWDSVYPVPAGEPDALTTYYGGQGAFSAGLGIQYIIDRDSLVQPLIDAGTPASVLVHQLCGIVANLPGVHNEHGGISDGALFLASCNAPDGIANRVTPASKLLNHLQLGWRVEGVSQVATWLN